MKVDILIPSQVKKILRILDAAGYEAYIVGGCVRDSILGKMPYDWDICTSAKPEQVLKLFKDYRTLTNGIKHGTITVIIQETCFEITTFRVDGDYTDNRHPDTVTFTGDLAQDLSRRDFTINAMAYHFEKGLSDPFNGLADCKKQLIRCVGAPEKRFEEDALRILRALRFACQLDFKIVFETETAIHKMKALIHHVASERIKSELDKMLLQVGIVRILTEYFDVWMEIIPELSQAKMQIPFLINAAKELSVRWAVLLAPVREVKNVIQRLRFEKKICAEIGVLLENQEIKLTKDRVFLKLLLKKYGATSVFQIISFQKALSGRNQKNIDDLEQVRIAAEKIIKNQECYQLSMLNISGDDLIQLGFKSGRKIGQILNDLLEQVILENVNNEKKDLIQYLQKN